MNPFSGLIFPQSYKLIPVLLVCSSLLCCSKWDLERSNPNDPGSDNNSDFPIINTLNPTEITSSSVKIGGSVSSDGGSSVVARGICWFTTEFPTITDNKTTEGSGTGNFSSEITGLRDGEVYYLRAWATNRSGTAYGNQIVIITPVTDADNNSYRTVKIGTQVWMAENLRSTIFNDGTPIRTETDNITWDGLTVPGYCWYNNDPVSNKDLYGALYNWYTIDPPSNGGKNVCPTGWHVPSATDWNTLSSFLGGNDVAGGKLKEANLSHWQSPNTGATDAFGFTLLPGGSRSAGTGFYGMSGFALLWYSGDNGACIIIQSQNRSLEWVNTGISNGLSIRCVKD